MGTGACCACMALPCNAAMRQCCATTPEGSTLNNRHEGLLARPSQHANPRQAPASALLFGKVRLAAFGVRLDSRPARPPVGRADLAMLIRELHITTSSNWISEQLFFEVALQDCNTAALKHCDTSSLGAICCSAKQESSCLTVRSHKSDFRHGVGMGQ